MKYLDSMRVIIIFFLISIFSCSRGLVSESSFKGTYYESHRGHLFGANQLWLNGDSTFRFIGNGPSIFLSQGFWKYDKLNYVIHLTSRHDILGIRKTVDSMWIDMTGKRIKVKNKEQLLLDEVVYYIK